MVLRNQTLHPKPREFWKEAYGGSASFVSTIKGAAAIYVLSGLSRASGERDTAVPFIVRRLRA